MAEGNGPLTRWARAALRVATSPLDRRGQHEHPDAIIVLGAPVNSDGILPDSVRERVEVGVELLSNSEADLLVMTGGQVRGPAEAPAMAAHARALGVASERLLVEDQSSSTRDNARRCAELLLPGRSRVVVVSQPFHLRRACRLFSEAGFDPVGAAAADSLHYRDPLRGWRWTVREYAALALAALKGPKSR